MQELLALTRARLTQALRRPDWWPAALRNLRTAHDDYSARQIFTAEFVDGTYCRWQVDDELAWRAGGRSINEQWEFVARVTSLYSELLEDELLRRELEPRRQAIIRLQSEGAPLSVVAEAVNELRLFERHVRRHHRENPVYCSVRVGVANGEPVNELRLEPGAVNYASGPELTALQVSEWIAELGLTRGFSERYANELLDAICYGTMSPPRLDPSERARFRELQREHERKQRAAQERAEQLLVSWLTPEQRGQYERDRCFEVVGSRSRRRYRIRHGRQMNVYALDADGREAQGYCFLPQGNLVEGDCMLAQKIALETDERAALKIANKFPAIAAQPAPRINSSSWTGI